MDYQIDETGPFIIGEKSDNEADNDFDFAIFKLKDANEKDGVSIEKVRSLPKEGTQVSIIQHPQGRTMELSVDEIVSTGANDFFYKADTNAGSSGSPVFDKKWRLIALHYGYNNEQNDGPQVSVSVPQQDQAQDPEENPPAEDPVEDA